LPGLTRRSIASMKRFVAMDARVKPGHDDSRIRIAEAEGRNA